MLKRVVVTGCSHAFGSEMGGRGENAGHDKLGFGPLLAEKLDLPLLLLARPGASNEFIKHQVFEHCEEGDLVINAWTYWDRFILWNADGTIKPSFGSSHEAGVVMMDKYPQFIDHSDWSQDRIDMVMENRYIKQRDNPLVQLASEYELMYYGENYTRFIRFLTDYFAVNSFLKSAGCKTINFQMDEKRSTYNELNDLKTDTELFQPTAMKYVPEVCPKTIEDTNIYNYWKHDNSRLPYIMIKYLKQEFGIAETEWPDNRMGHLGPEQHQMMYHILREHIHDNSWH